MKRFFESVVKCFNEAIEIMNRTDAYSVEYPSNATFRMF